MDRLVCAGNRIEALRAQKHSVLTAPSACLREKRVNNACEERLECLHVWITVHYLYA